MKKEPSKTVDSYEVNELLKGGLDDPLETWNRVRSQLGKDSVKALSDLNGGVELAYRGLTGDETEQIFGLFDRINEQLRGDNNG